MAFFVFFNCDETKQNTSMCQRQKRKVKNSLFLIRKINLVPNSILFYAAKKSSSSSNAFSATTGILLESTSALL